MNLAEIIEEGKRLQSAVADSDLFVDRFDRVRDWEAWCRRHGHRLLAVAEAAVEMRRFIRHNEQCLIWATGAPRCTCGLTDTDAAFDAAALAGKEKTT